MQRRKFTSLTLSFLGGWSVIGLMLLFLATISSETTTAAPNQANTNNTKSIKVWDDADSHFWIGEPWGDDNELEWVTFEDRQVLQIKIASTISGWSLIRTDAFPAENWGDKTALRADIYLAGDNSGLDVKLEPREASFDPSLEQITCYNLTPNDWNTCTWIFSEPIDYSQVSHLSLVFDQLSGPPPIFYIDNFRLVTANGEEEWDDMDDGSRQWFYFGNWLDWSPDHLFGLELISHNGDHPASPAGSVYLQWDYENGCCPPQTSAEIGTQQVSDVPDWGIYDQLIADVKVSNPNVPIRLFFWDEDTQKGHLTAPQKVSASDTWETISWRLNWPADFDTSSVDEIKFVVQEIDLYQTGTLFLDNIILAPSLSYTVENYDNSNLEFNDLQGNWGPLKGEYITLTYDRDVYQGSVGGSLRIEYDLSSAPTEFTGMWHSLWGHSDFTQTQYVDFTDIYGDLNEPDKDFEELRFWVRGSGTTAQIHQIKVELKDTRKDFNYTAYTYVTINDGDTTWQKIVLDADVTNTSFWSYNTNPPDPAQMKELVFVIEGNLNQPTGTLYLDNIAFIDHDDIPFDLTQHTDDEFLDHLSQKTFLYFLDWYDPNTGLFQDRSTFPDLMSTASTGFGLTALAIGEERGWITHPKAEEMVLRTLQTLRDGQSETSTVADAVANTNGYRGFYYHFLGPDGLRSDPGSELSPVDTALLMAGVLTVRQHFIDNSEIVSLADELYARIEWGWLIDRTDTPGTNNHFNQFYLAWTPECGLHHNQPAFDGGCFSDFYWDFYTDEVILLTILAISSPTHPESEDIFYAWFRDWGTYKDHTFVQSWTGSFFTYDFAHLWIDFHRRKSDNHPDPTKQVNWWHNSVEAASANWQFVMDHSDDQPCDGDENYTTYNWGGWLTASDGPDGYEAFGSDPAAGGSISDGTMQPYGAGMAMMFLPGKAISILKNYYIQTDLWRNRFGFGDAYNLDPATCDGPWVNHVLFGIDQGPMLISIENYRSRFVWNTFGQNPYTNSTLANIAPYAIWLPIIFR